MPKQTVVFEATPAKGYKFNKWGIFGTPYPERTSVGSVTIPGELLSSSTDSRVAIELLFQKDYQSIYVSATFTKIPAYTVTLSASPSNGGSVTGNGTFDENTSVSVRATPSSGWTFLRWTENGLQVSNSQTYTFNIGGNRNLVAVFEPPSYRITVSASPTNGGTASGGGTFKLDSYATVTASPASGYAFSYWSEGGNNVSSQQRYQFQVTKARTLSAVFRLLPPAAPASFNVPQQFWPNERFDITWGASPHATGYELKRHVNGAAEGQPVSSSGTSASDTPAESWQTVYYTLTAKNSAGSSGAVTSGTATPYVLQAPAASLPESVVIGQEAKITWNASDGAKSYKLQRAVNVEAYRLQDRDWTDIYGGASTAWNDQVKPEWKRVCYRVTAIRNSLSSVGPVAERQAGIPAPPSITVPDGLEETAAFTVSWEAAQYAEGYVLERATGGGAWEGVHSGAETSLAQTPGDWRSVRYRVKATKAGYLDSAYAESESRSVKTRNDPPRISCAYQDGADLGNVLKGFKVGYTVTDRENAAVTVTEKLNGNQARRHQPTLGQRQEFDVSGSRFMSLPVGRNELSIEAADSEHTSRISIRFFKGGPGAVQHVMDRGRRVELGEIAIITDRGRKTAFPSVSHIMDHGKRHEVIRP